MQRFMKTAALAAMLLVAAMLCVPTAHADEEYLTPDELAFGVISTESSAGLKRGFEPFFDDMEEALGIPVKGYYATDYAGIIEGMRFKKVHVAWFGNKSAMEAVNRANGEIFAQTVDVTGNPGYWSLIITHKDSGITSLEQILRNPGQYTFGNGDPNSTSGFLIPSYYLWAQNDINPAEDFKQMRNANHEANLFAVVNKQVDFATNNTESYSRFGENHGEDQLDKVRILWKSPLIPNDPLVWRADLDPELKARIKGFILGYGRVGPDAEAERAVLANMSSGWGPFNDSSNAQLIPIREIQLTKDRKKVEQSSLPLEEKHKRIAEIDAQIEEVRTLGALMQKY